MVNVVRRNVKKAPALVIGTVVVYIAEFALTGGTLSAHEADRIRMPGPAIQDLMLGTWAIAVKHQPSPALPKGGVGKGREVWRLGPGGRSLIEEYDEQGPEGTIHEFGIAWWDHNAKGQRVLWCGDYETGGCQTVPDVARWDGNSLVHTVESDDGGKHLVRQEIFMDITPGSFTQVLKEGPSKAGLKVTTIIHATRIADQAESK